MASGHADPRTAAIFAPGFSFFLVTSQHVPGTLGPGWMLASEECQSCHFTHHSKSVDSKGGSLEGV